jgi:aerobic C4-dicarboxylate transport protein
VKIWVKLLIGSIVGALIGIFLPTTGAAAEVLAFLSRLFIQIGRYVVFPLAFFALVVGTFELKREKKLAALYGRLVLYLLLSTLLLILVGVGVLLAFSPERIPIIVEREASFHHINSLLCELFGFAMVVIAAVFLTTMRQRDLALFRQMLIIIGIDAAVVIFALYPLLLYVLGGRENPYKWLYGVIGPALVAFFTGDSYLSVTMLVKHGRENLGVPRRVGATVYPLFAVFGKAGTALVTASSFLLILKSYSSLEISALQILWTIAFTLVVSLTLGSVPGMAAYVALASLSGLFGRGLQEGYLILRPIAPLLISFGVLLDVLTSAFVSYLMARRGDDWEKVEPYEFV